MKKRKLRQEDRLKLLGWTERWNTKSEPTAYRFLVEYEHEHCYYITGTHGAGAELIEVKMETSARDRNMRGHTVMNLAEPRLLSTHEIIQRKMWIDYLLPIVERHHHNGDVDNGFEERKITCLTKSIFSPFCALKVIMSDAESDPDTASKYNLSECSGDTEFDVKNQSLTESWKLVWPNEIDDLDELPTCDESDNFLDLFMDFEKAKKKNVTYRRLQQDILPGVLPYYVHIHIPLIVDMVRIVFPDPQLNTILKQACADCWIRIYDNNKTPPDLNDQAHKEDDP